MLLTWMAFRGKFPRAEPLHFLDPDLGPTTRRLSHFRGTRVFHPRALHLAFVDGTHSAPVPLAARHGSCVAGPVDDDSGGAQRANGAAETGRFSSVGKTCSQRCLL